MPYAPLISKIRCHNPNKSGSRVANRNYLTYIATREGVDLNHLHSIDDLFINNKVFETELNDTIVHQEASNDNYIRYMANRPRSHGLFGNIETNDLDSIAKKVSKLTDEGKNIYRGIISLSEKDAEALGFVNKDTWNLYLRKVMPDIAKELGVSISNFTWVAAFHAEKTHPHIHFELWDNTSKVKTPFIHKSVQIKCRQLLSDAIFDEVYENTIKEVFKEERAELNKIRNNSRNEITNTVKDIFNKADLFVPGMVIEKLPSRITNIEVENLSYKLTELVNLLPTKGSIDYAYLSPDLKEKVNDICNVLFIRSDIKQELNNYLSAVEEGGKLIGKTKYEIEISKERSLEDINKRVANIILKQAKHIKETSNEIILNISKAEQNNIDIDKLEVSINSPKVNNLSDDFNNYYNEAIITQSSEMVTHNLIDDMIPLPNKQELDDNISDDLINFNNEKMDFENIIPNSINSETSNSNTTKYFIDWNDNYKEALHYLYDTKDQNFDKAFDLLTVEANNNNVLAIHDLGKMYEKGLGRDIDISKASQFYETSLTGFMDIEKSKNHKYVEYRIGKLFDSGKGTQQNFDEAAYWYQKSANQKYKYAQYSLGMLYRNDKLKDLSFDTKEQNHCEAFILFKASAEQNNAYASYELAKMYEKGIGTILDLKLANQSYKDAFNGFLEMSYGREDDNLMYRIGSMYYKGQGTEKNIEKAIEYLDKSSKLNNANAIYLLAKIYIESGDFSKVKEAVTLLQRLCNADNDMAQFSLGKLYYEGKTIEKDINKAIDLLTKSAEKGNQFSQYYLGNIYSDPKSGFYNINDAIDWYSKSADQSNQFAQYKLGKLFYSGKEIRPDLNKAIMYFKASADQKNAYAQYYLGKIFIDKNFIKYNPDEALNWFNLSAAQGNQYAQYQLGKMYLWGKHVDKNEELGLYWMKQSAEQGNKVAIASLQFYENYKNSFIPGVAYGMVKTVYNMISTEKQKAVSFQEDKYYASKSKQARKEAALRNKAPGAAEEE